MKTKLLILIAIVFTFSTIYSCCESCKTEAPSPDKEVRDKKYHPKITIQCNEDSWYQPFHSDLINGYMIVGKMLTCSDRTVTKVEFNILEPRNCTRYKVVGVEWVPYSSSGNEYTHKITFEVQPIQYLSEQTSFIFDGPIEYEPQNRMMIQIISNDESIITTPYDPVGNPNKGPIACPIEII